MIGEKEESLDKNFESLNKGEYKNFVIIALGWLGDTLLSDGLCKNIKRYNPDAKITFVPLKSFVDIPKLIPEVDEIIPFDKKGAHKGLLGYAKFSKHFKNKEIDVAIIVHPHERSVLCAKAMGAKTIVSLPLKGKFNPINFLINKKRKYVEDEIRNEYKNNYNANYLNTIGVDTEKYAPSFSIPESENIDITRFDLPEKYIALVPEGKDTLKHWDYENISAFIQNSKIPCVLTGTAKTQELADKLKLDGVDFVNLCGKTTILELAKVIKESQVTVTVDTGSMHLAYGLGVQTVCLLFVEKMIKEWLAKDLPNVHLLLGEKFRRGGEIVTQQNIDYREVLDVVERVGVDYAQV